VGSPSFQKGNPPRKVEAGAELKFQKQKPFHGLIEEFQPTANKDFLFETGFCYLAGLELAVVLH
jgi:hypothetical protein